MENLPENLKLIRIARGYSKWKLAKETGYDWNTINAWEKGDWKPSEDALKAITEVLKCTVVDLVSPDTKNNPEYAPKTEAKK